MPTQKEVENAIDNVKKYMLIAVELDKQEKDVKLAKIKNHNDLRLARDVLNSIRFGH